VLTQRVSTASTQPRKGQTPSQATISKLSKAMSDPTRTKYGETLGGRAGGCIAPDGGSCGDYPKGWRFLPYTYSLFTPGQGYSSGQIEMVTTVEQIDELKNHPKVKDAMHEMNNLSFIPTSYRFQRFTSDAEKQAHYTKVAKHQKVITDHHYSLVIAPQIKADQELKKNYEEEQKQTIATLKMRVQELTKRPISQPTAPAVTSSLPIIPIIIIAVIVGFFLLRRRA